MDITGIICEYNPFHLGHERQLHSVRALRGSESGIVCLMSGNFVQRGHPAIFDKSLRAEAAVRCGADLVLELPISYALSSAEGFAAGGVQILSGFCRNLCFGAETADTGLLLATARALLSPDFPPALHDALDRGLSFPAARQKALEAMGCEASLLTTPNNILAVEYCKAILSQGSSMQPLPIRRPGSYHAALPDPENPSATALRCLIEEDGAWQSYVPEEASAVFASAQPHALHCGERAILAILRAMTDAEFEALPYGSEGLWRKLMHAARTEASLEAVISSVKSKRYTRTRLDRMILCAFLGLSQLDLQTQPPYVRVLAFNDRGRAILKEARKTGVFLNAGEAADSPYWEAEQRIGDLYGLFSVGMPEAPGTEKRRRVYYQPE